MSTPPILYCERIPGTQPGQGISLQGVDEELRKRHLPALSSTHHHLARWDRLHPSDDTLRASFVVWVGRMSPTQGGGLLTVYAEGNRIKMQTLQNLAMEMVPGAMRVQGLESPSRDLVGVWQAAPTDWTEGMDEEEFMDRIMTRGQSPDAVTTFWRPPWAPTCEVLFVPLEPESDASSIPTMWTAWLRHRLRATPMPESETTEEMVPPPGTMMRLHYMYLHAQQRVYMLCEDEESCLWIFVL